jgi:hypothetical protein
MLEVVAIFAVGRSQACAAAGVASVVVMDALSLQHVDSFFLG